jgi:hypothetical protein
VKTAEPGMLALAVAVLVAGCTGTNDRHFAKDLTATAACRGPAAEVRFDPGGEIEVSVGGKAVAWANRGGRGLAFAVCPQVRTQRGWRTTQDTVTRKATTLTCHLPRRFYVHVHPVYSSESGEFSPDGSSVYVVVRSRGGLSPHWRFAAAATVMRRDAESALTYSSRSCR